MNILVTFLVALGLSLDAFSAAVVCGFAKKKPQLRYAFRVAFSFGLFQAIMPVIGWKAGGLLTEYISGVDHWIAFLLLSLIGLHMIYESTKSTHEKISFEISNFRTLLLLSVATSIDALTVGVGLAFVEIAIIRTALIIGMVTFVLSFIGYYIGNRIGITLGDKVKIVGGVILIAIGLRILVQHLR